MRASGRLRILSVGRPDPRPPKRPHVCNGRVLVVSESGGWCLLALLWFGGPVGALTAAVRLWADDRVLAWAAVAAIVLQVAGHVAGALLVRDRLPGPEDAWTYLGLLGGVAGLALGAYSLVA
jgi:hypothetical protein